MTGSCGIIILAAGSSGRLGKPKQLLPYKNKNLLEYLIEEAKASSVSSIVVVLGYQIRRKSSAFLGSLHITTQSLA